VKLDLNPAGRGGSRRSGALKATPLQLQGLQRPGERKASGLKA